MVIQQKVILSLLSISTFLFLIWIHCTDPTSPNFYPPTIENNKEIQTFGTSVVDSAFGMYIGAQGAKPLTFQWYKDTTFIDSYRSKIINDTLKFPALALTDSGVYKCIVTNSEGADTSKNFSLIPYLDVIKPAITLISPQDNSITGDSLLKVTFKVIDQSGVSSVTVNGAAVTSQMIVFISIQLPFLLDKIQLLSLL